MAMDLPLLGPYAASVRTVALWVSICALVGCKTSDPARQRIDASEASTPQRQSSSPSGPSASASGSGATPAPASASAPLDPKASVPCTSDKDCGWDDGCTPKRCVQAQPPTACEESSPPPGSCLCVQGACTLKPKQPPTTSGSCEVRGCVVDRSGGACIADTGGVAEGLRTNVGVDLGPSCDCIDPKQGCTFQWFEPVACKTDRDCWIEQNPRPHPIKRPAQLRGRDFKPCSDGETEPSCGPAGQCVRGRHYKC